MAFETNTRIDVPAFALKLRSSFPNGDTYGTGFVVAYAGASWLFTCWHNLGPVQPNSVDLTGEMTASRITFVEHPAKPLVLGERRIVGATLDGLPVDVAAIELSDDEIPPPPLFEGKRTLWLKGIPAEPTFTLSGHGEGEGIIVPISRHYIWQGFPGQDMSVPPESYRAVDFPGSHARHPWMLRYTPGGYPGASGCPVILLEGEEARLAGIHVHLTTTAEGRTIKFHGHSTKDGRRITAHASFEWGSAVPIELMYRAIDLAASSGVTMAVLSQRDLALV